MEESILAAVARKKLVWKKADEEINLDPEMASLKCLLHTDAETFLLKYGTMLDSKQLEYFNEYRNCDKVDYYLTKLSNLLERKRNRSKLRNKRYTVLLRLIEEGNYFSDQEMESRDPYLYQEMIGKHLTQEEIREMEDQMLNRDELEKPLTYFLLNSVDKSMKKARISLQASQMEDEEEEDEDEDEEEKIDEDESEHHPEVCIGEEKDRLRKDFISIMYQRFLAGKDGEYFDYSTIDYSQELGEFESQDAEDKYFDSEEPN